MIECPPFGSQSFKLVAKGLVELHALIKRGDDDSPEAESIRDALDAPLKALNPVEKERAQFLSEDLYSVSEPPTATAQKEMNAQAQQQLNEAFEARENRKWEQALSILRRWKEYIAPALLSYMRGRIWLEAGYPGVAAAYFGHASETDPTNPSYRALYMEALAESDPSAAQKEAARVLSEDSRYPIAVVAEAANVRLQEMGTASDAQIDRMCRELIPILERNLGRIEQEGHASNLAPIYEMTVGKLGICYEVLGNSGAAVDYFSRGIQSNPNNDGLLVARGILLYGTSPRGIADLERAAALDSSIIWPYLFLAHHDLATSQFERCRVMCEAGLTRHGSATVKSQLEEWRAISQAELGFPPEAIKAAFEAALRWDPANEIAKRNQEAFESFLRVPRMRPHSQWQQRSEAAIRQLAMAERRYSFAA